MRAKTFRLQKSISIQALCGLASLLVAVAFSGCAPKNEYQEPPPPTVTVANPIQKMVVQSMEFTGTTEAINMVEIRARVEGFLESIEFEEGKAVKKGDLLFTIDPRPFEAELAQAQASIKLAQARVASGKADENRAIAEVANANAQLARAEKAAASGAITASEIDVLKTDVLTSRAGVEAAKASITSAEAEIAAGEALVEQAQLNLEYTKVRSPIDGRAGRRLVDIGNLVGSTESTLLTKLVQYDPVYAFFTINENDLLEFNRQHVEELVEAQDGTSGDDAEMRLNQQVFIGLGDEEGFPYEGIADYADLAVDQSTGTFEIRAVIPNPTRVIPPGAFIRIRVPREEIEAVLIDERAIGRDQSGAYLLVVNSENVVDRRTVTLGAVYEGLQSVQGDIGPEDRVIVNGLQRARPGAKVTPQEQSSAAAEPAQTSEEAPSDTPSTEE